MWERNFSDILQNLVQIAFECTPVSHRSLHKKSPKSFKSLQFRFLNHCSSGALVPLMSLCAISPVFVMSIDNQGWISDQVRKQRMKNGAPFSFLKSCLLNLRYWFVCVYILHEYMCAVRPACEYMRADLSIDVCLSLEKKYWLLLNVSVGLIKIGFQANVALYSAYIGTKEMYICWYTVKYTKYRNTDKRWLAHIEPQRNVYLTVGFLRSANPIQAKSSHRWLVLSITPPEKETPFQKTQIFSFDGN